VASGSTPMLIDRSKLKQLMRKTLLFVSYIIMKTLVYIVLEAKV